MRLCFNRILAAMTTLSLMFLWACAPEAGGVSITGAEVNASMRSGLETTVLTATRATLFVDEVSVLHSSLDRATEMLALEGGAETSSGLALGSAIDDATRRFIEERVMTVFVDENIEDQADQRILYKLPDPCDGASDCRDPELRFVVTAPAHGALDVSVHLGPGSVDVGSVAIRSGSVSVELDLDALQSALNLSELEARGRLRVDLKQTGEGQFRLRGSVLKAINVRYLEGFQLEIGEGDDVFTATLDERSRELRIENNWRAVGLVLGGGVFAQESCSLSSGGATVCERGPNLFESLAVSLSGLSGALILDGDAETLEVQGLRLGEDALTVDADGRQVLSLALNPTHGRALDVDLFHDGERLNVTVRPNFELLVALAFENFPDTSELEPWMLRETLRFALGDGASSIALDGDTLEVTSGRLELTSEQFSLTAEAGECVQASASGGEQHLIGQLEVTGCQ